MTEQYGPPIPVNGRPDWLRDDELVEHTTKPECIRVAKYAVRADWLMWPNIEAIRLPITHPASICQQRALDHPDEAPFYPVHADGTVPVDYDGGAVLTRKGIALPGPWLQPHTWCDEGSSSDTVGYRRKATTAGPIPTCAPELPTYDPATHVLVERMTRDQFAKLYMGWKTTAIFDALGAIKPDPDPIAEYAAKHGLDVDELRALVKGVAA